MAHNRQEMADRLEMSRGKEPKKKYDNNEKNEKTNLLLLFLIAMMLLFLYNAMKGKEPWKWRVGREYEALQKSDCLVSITR